MDKPSLFKSKSTLIGGLSGVIGTIISMFTFKIIAISTPGYAAAFITFLRVADATNQRLSHYEFFVILLALIINFLFFGLIGFLFELSSKSKYKFLYYFLLVLGCFISFALGLFTQAVFVPT